jgi:hypothetical protein
MDKAKDLAGKDRIGFLLESDMAKLFRPVLSDRKDAPARPDPPRNPNGGASSPSPERIKEAIREANDPSRFIPPPPQPPKK